MNPLKQRKHKPAKNVEEKFGYALKETFLRFFGDLKFFGEQPRLFVLPHLLITTSIGGALLYDPRSYQVKGSDMRKAMADIQPGDILVRGFDNYVDGNFIPGFSAMSGCIWAKWMKKPYASIGVALFRAAQYPKQITRLSKRYWKKP